MRIEKMKVIEDIMQQLSVSGNDNYKIVEVSAKNFRKKKKEVNDIVRDCPNAWTNLEKTKEVFKFLESNKDSDGMIRMKYFNLLEEERRIVMDRYSCDVKNTSIDIYWYPDKAKHLLKALSHLNELVVRNLEDDILEDDFNFTLYEEFLDINDDFEEDVCFSKIDWSDITNSELYPEYDYD